MSIASYAPRDSNGWRIPREGTLSRQIYELTVAGWEPHHIADKLDIDSNNARMLIFKFKNPAKTNLRQNHFNDDIRKLRDDTKAWGKVDRLHEIVTGKRRKSLIWYLITHTHANASQLMDYVYAMDADGGPESTKVIYIMIRKINEMIEHRGFKIKSTGGPGATYSLVRL